MYTPPLRGVSPYFITNKMPTNTLLHGIEPLDPAGEGCLSTILDYFYQPNSQRVRPRRIDVAFSFAYLEMVNPALRSRMIQDYRINPSTLRLLEDLSLDLNQQLQDLHMELQQNLPPAEPQLPPHLPDPAQSHVLSCGIYGQLFKGAGGFLVGPELKFDRLGNRSIKLNCEISYDQANQGESGKIGGFFSASKQRVKGRVDVKSGLSQNSLESTITAQTDNPTFGNIGIQFKNKQSSRVQTVGIVVSHNIQSDKVETTTTGCIPTPLFDRSDLQGKNKKQVKSSASSAKTRAERQQRQQRQQTQCIQQPQPVIVCMHSSPALASKAFLFAVLVYLFFNFVRRIVAFLKTKKLK